jgi:hypothetical protein
MTEKELIYLAASQIYSSLLSTPTKVGGQTLNRQQLEDEALSIATDMYGKLPKYVKYAKKLYKEEKEYYQITDEEIQ